jgi:hypothetical protein
VKAAVLHIVSPNHYRYTRRQAQAEAADPFQSVKEEGIGDVHAVAEVDNL